MISETTKAILLLTGHLLDGSKNASSSPLTLTKYNALARALHKSGYEPGDLVTPKKTSIFDALSNEPIFEKIGEEKIEALLARGLQLANALDKWASRSIWVMSRAEACYPKRLRKKLGNNAPPVIFGVGEPSLLEKGGLAVVGSRKVDDIIKAYVAETGSLASRAGYSIVSGAARGIDSSAMGGALETGGSVIGIMADSLWRASVAAGNRTPISEGRLVLISAVDPSAGFNVGNAMQRNKSIYALADAALVVRTDHNKGGTWNGAIEQLEKLRFCPVFVHGGEHQGDGNEALLRKGAICWPEPKMPDELRAVIEKAEAPKPPPEQTDLPLNLNAESPPIQQKETPEGDAIKGRGTILEAVTDAVVKELQQGAKTGKEIAESLEVRPAQMNDWLAQLVESGLVSKLNRPARYSLPVQTAS